MTENEIVKEYQYLVPIIARPFFLAGAEQEDLEQIGRIGLLHGIRTYRESDGVQFRTYASRCIKNEILKAVKKAAANNNSILTKAETLESIDIAGITEDTIVDTVYYRSLLELFLKNIVPLERQVVELFFQGYSYREIGEKLSLSAKDVDNIIQRIRKNNVVSVQISLK